jgi:hypothetical protein
VDVTAGSVSLSNDTLSGYIVHGGKGGNGGGSAGTFFSFNGIGGKGGTGGSGIGGGLYIGTGRRPLYSSADSVNGLTGPGKLGRISKSWPITGIPSWRSSSSSRMVPCRP